MPDDDSPPEFDKERFLEAHRRTCDAVAALHSVAMEALVETHTRTCAWIGEDPSSIYESEPDQDDGN